MVKKSKGWDFNEMQESLVKDTEQRISDGFQKIANGQQVGEHQPSDTPPLIPRGGRKAPSLGRVGEGSLLSSVSPQPSEQEPTKGVQTYIPMSMYRRLNDIKLTRRENIAALVAQAIALWLDVQEGKRKVSE